MSEDFSQATKYKFSNKLKKITPLGNTILARDMNFSERRTTGGIVLVGDDGKSSGIRPRWCRVYAIGPDQKDVEVNEWILVSHGRWSRGIDVEIEDEKFTIRKIDPKDILLSSTESPNDDTVSDAVQVEQKHR